MDRWTEVFTIPPSLKCWVKHGDNNFLDTKCSGELKTGQFSRFDGNYQLKAATLSLSTLFSAV